MGKPKVVDVAEVKACAAELMRAHGVDEATALRFSRARDGDSKKASAFLAADLAWVSRERRAVCLS